ncbi:S9 family peptidase [Singulisphaera acidiphila]|uniref:Dipeptidyl aminopeptidase/acylaminoacyl peptidase n=1 Tax=Singulisphaera acidiphila (strain ATCC BAA-1392 / DSM 18658 / VKM B-2454 / MOB10) TaxID=886293 RepID=L0DLI7_SINAD|nr:S9 family peptidase [Singulisphaera acidiphila]AGA30107.1 dipeptidyl aminopeptidase/acylaminoacyl peptidase [Singulisphaera acidiphila DSM 18658]
MSERSKLWAETPDTSRKGVDAAAVAKLPTPGSVVPAAFGFTPDGKALSYLKSESASLSRVLWRVDLTAGEPRVVARPPGDGDTESTLSEAEKLRRERQRLRETGITQVVRAEAADVSVFPIGGDLYLQRQDGPLERITNTPTPELDPRLSRDGTKVAFVRNDELHVIDLATKQERQLSQGAGDGLTHGLAEFIAQEEMDRANGYWWSPDGATIAYQETDERHIPLYSIVHQGGEKISVETHRYPFAGEANAKVKLGVVSTEGGATRWLELEEPGADFYLARVNWASPSSLLVQTLSRDQKRLRLYRFDVESLRKTLLIEETAETWINLHHDLRVLDSTGEILWSSERTGFRHLQLHDRDGKLLRTLTSGDWPVDALVALDEHRREAWFSAGRETPLEVHLYRVTLDGGEVVRLTDEPGTHRAVVAQGGEHFVDVASSLDRPSITTIRDRAGKILKTLDDASSDPRVGALWLAPPELVEFVNRDGIKLQGAFYPPKSKVLGEKAPLVVIVYGGPHVQTVSNAWTLSADMNAQFLTERGFAVWKADNRGSARRGLAFESALNRQMGNVEVRDQVDGVKFVGEHWPDVDLERVGVTGSSYGGYMTLRALTEAPDLFRAGVSVAPVTDWDGYDTCYTERYMGTPANNAEGYRRSSVLSHVESLRGELLVIHGMLDENVHFRHTARLTTALISAAKPFALLPLPDERHSSRRDPDRKYVAERIAGFFEQALRSR